MQEEKEPEKWSENEQHIESKERHNVNKKLIINDINLGYHRTCTFGPCPRFLAHSSYQFRNLQSGKSTFCMLMR